MQFHTRALLPGFQLIMIQLTQLWVIYSYYYICVRLWLLFKRLISDLFYVQVFVGGLDPTVTDEHLKNVFSQYGEIVHVKIPAGKRCGFVQFSEK